MATIEATEVRRMLKIGRVTRANYQVKFSEEEYECIITALGGTNDNQTPGSRDLYNEFLEAKI